MQRVRGFVRQRGVAIGLVATLLLSGGGVAAFTWPWSTPTADTYRTQPVTKGTIATTVTTSGPLSASTSLSFGFQNAGTITAVEVKVCDQVQAGQTLAQLDPTDVNAALTTARANYDKAVAAYNALVAGPTQQDLAVAQASLDSAKTALANAQNNLATAQQSTAQDLVIAQAAVDTARKQVDTATQTLNATVLPQNQQDLATAQLAVANANTAYANAQKAYQATQAQIAQDTRVSQLTADNAQVAVAQAVNTFNGVTSSTQQDLNVAQGQLQTSQLALKNAQAAVDNYATGTNAVGLANVKADGGRRPGELRADGQESDDPGPAGDRQGRHGPIRSHQRAEQGQQLRRELQPAGL